MTVPSFRSMVAVALQHVALAAFLFLLLIGWLHIPDANAIEVFGSVVTALLIAAVAGAGESAIALRLTNRRATTRRLLLGTGAVCLAALLWFAISLGVDHLSTKQGLWVGYLNSRFPASLRQAFSYEHLFLWFEWAGRALRWGVAGLLAAAIFACITCDRLLFGVRAIFGSAKYWGTLLLLMIVGVGITPALLAWTPGHGIRVEMLSLVLRVSILIALSAISVALLLQAMAQAVLRIQSVGTGEPATSQPRTVDIP